jgi:HlyD family secretion protein
MTIKQSDQTAQTRPDENQEPKRFWQKRPFVIGSIIAVLLLAVVIGAVYFGARQQAKVRADNFVRLSGRIEGAESHLGARIPAQVKAVYVKEGQQVHKGQLLIALDDSDVSAKISAVSGGLNAAAGAERQARAGAGAIEHEAAVAQEKMQPKHHNVISRFFRKVTGANKKEMAVKMQVETQITSQKLQAQQAVAQARGEYEKALVARKIVSADRSSFRIVSPIDGIVETSNVQPGDAVTPGQVLITIVNLHDVYMRGFVAESDVGKISVGQAARIYLDSDRKQPLSGHISSIDQQASFTPENVYFEKDRATQAFGVKIAIDNADGRAKPGMPVDAKIKLSHHGSNQQTKELSASDWDPDADSSDQATQERQR